MYCLHAVVKNDCFSQDLMSDVDAIFCLHELLQVFIMEEKLRTELPHRAEPQNQNKQKTQSKLEMSLSLLMKWVTSQVVIIPGTGCEWFSKENEDFFILFIPSSLGIRVCSYSRETLHLRRHNPKSYLPREELLTTGITV